MSDARFSSRPLYGKVSPILGAPNLRSLVRTVAHCVPEIAQDLSAIGLDRSEHSSKAFLVFRRTPAKTLVISSTLIPESGRESPAAGVMDVRHRLDEDQCRFIPDCRLGTPKKRLGDRTHILLIVGGAMSEN